MEARRETIEKLHTEYNSKVKERASLQNQRKCVYSFMRTTYPIIDVDFIILEQFVPHT